MVPPSTARPLNVQQTLAQALDLHGKGHMAEAGRLYSAILQVRPDHFDALQMLGLVKLAAGEPAEALRLVSAAMQLRAPSPQILVNYGLVLNALQRHEDALESFERAIKLKSRYPEAHNNRGGVLSTLGRDEEALEACRKAVALKPDYADAHYNMGNALRALGRYDEALKCYDRALTLRPNYAEAHNNRGTVLDAQEKREEARACFEQALALKPGFTEALNNLCRALCHLTRFDEALRISAEALARNPNDPELHFNRAGVMIDLNRNDDAIAEYDKALALRPDYPDARVAQCLAELPIIYADHDEILRRRAAYEKSLRRLSADFDAGRLTGDCVKALSARHPFFLAYHGENDRALQTLYGEMVCRVVGQRFAPAELPPPPTPGEPIRVGVVSSFFYLHSNWKIPIKGWLSQLDRSRFKLYGYYVGAKKDAETEVAASLCARFVHRKLDVEGWRNEILADAPHVLIYPGLLMDGLSLSLGAQRLAPVQCNSWGHPETSGMPTLDYFLSSDGMEPPGAEAFYTEKLVRLPNLSVYYVPVKNDPVTVTREGLGLRSGATAFWCGQSLFKYLPQYDWVFARIAKQVGDCQFAFVRHFGGEPVNDLFQARLARAFAAEGLNAADHCVYVPRLKPSRFFAAIGQCDVFLDSLEWSGCNSALEGLPHHLPLVTYEGKLMRGRHSAAILRMMGVTETIASTIDDYVALAVRLGRSPDERQALRARMQAAEEKVYRDRQCVTALEDLLERAVRGPA